LVQISNSIIQVSSFNDFVLAVDLNGFCWAWGNNEYGQLGNGNCRDSNIPLEVSNVLNVKEISAGFWHSLALTYDGKVFAWGYNNYGQLGNGTFIDSRIPVQVLNLENVEKIGGGGYFQSIALKYDGTVWTWGSNLYGELGNGTYEPSNIPVQVLNLTDIIDVSAGGHHCLALKDDGTVWAWGYNEFGQLGIGNNENQNTPVQIPYLSNVIKIAAGEYHSYALKNDGTLWAWGYNNDGQLGTGNFLNSNIPLQVLNISNVISISPTSYFHYLSKTSDGTLWAWGYGRRGELGNGSNEISPVPVQVLNIDGNIKKLGSGGGHSFALKEDGTLMVWGYNFFGQLGIGNYDNSYLPMQFSSLNDIVDIALGDYHSLVLTKECKNDLGDLNLNALLSSYDASLLLQYIVGNISLEEEQICRADVNRNSVITSLDASEVLKCVISNCDILDENFLNSCQKHNLCL